MNIIQIEAETITPFAYHSLMVQNGTATIPELISDRAICFGLALALGMTQARTALPPKDYYTHISAMPYRASLFTTDKPELLPPLVCRLNLDAEAGLQKKIQDVAKKGNLKDFFFIQEVPPYQKFKGVLFGFEGFNPFEYVEKDEIVIRVGLHQRGMVRLKQMKKSPDKDFTKVRLNCSTAALFGKKLKVDRYLLHTLQLTQLMNIDDALDEVATWR